jgi:hypothetical protein
MTQRVKTIRQIDADMLCCIKKQKDKDEHISFTQRPKDMC